MVSTKMATISSTTWVDRRCCTWRQMGSFKRSSLQSYRSVTTGQRCRKTTGCEQNAQNQRNERSRLERRTCGSGVEHAPVRDLVDCDLYARKARSAFYGG